MKYGESQAFRAVLNRFIVDRVIFHNSEERLRWLEAMEQIESVDALWKYPLTRFEDYETMLLWTAFFYECISKPAGTEYCSKSTDIAQGLQFSLKKCFDYLKESCDITFDLALGEFFEPCSASQSSESDTKSVKSAMEDE